MKKKLIIETMVYLVFVVIGIVMLLLYKPGPVELSLPQDFQLEQEGGEEHVAVPVKQ